MSTSTAEKFEAVKGEVQTAWHDLSQYVAEHFEKAQEAVFPKTDAADAAAKVEVSLASKIN